DATPAHTMIVSDRRPATTATAMPSLPPLPATDAAAIRALLDAETATWMRCDVMRAMDVYWRSPELEIVDGTTVIRGWTQAVEARARICRPLASIHVAKLHLAGAGDTASLSGRWEMGYGQTRAFTMQMRRFPNGQWKIVRETFP